MESNLKQTKKHEPLFKVFKRGDMPKWKALIIRFSATLGAIIFSMILAGIIIGRSPFAIFGTMVRGAFSLPWRLLYDGIILLGFGVAIVPAFKMKFWNMGANGQVLVGCLAAVLIMFYYGDGMNNFILILLMFICSLLASIIWAVVPALFKAFFKTNETLFTLMMNYIAIGLVAYCNFAMAKGKKETPGIVNDLTEKGWVNFNFLPPTVKSYILPIIVIIIITFLIYVYINKTKHGFEVNVLGDSENTARYAGMNTKWITIRTLMISGIICGIIGFLFASCVHHCVTVNLCGGKGFSGVLIAWLSNFNPLIMAGVSLFMAFIDNGTSSVTATYSLGSNALSSVIIGLIFFAILISKFFIRYRVVRRDRHQENKHNDSIIEEAKQC